jgi:hypothetical protein
VPPRRGSPPDPTPIGHPAGPMRFRFRRASPLVACALIRGDRSAGMIAEVLGRGRRVDGFTELWHLYARRG